MTPSVVRVKTKVILSYHTKGVSNQVHQIRITKSKVIHVQIPVPKWEKIFWVTKRGNKGITNRGRFYGFRIGARGITNRVSFRDFKSGQKDYKLGLRFQIRAKRFQISVEQLLFHKTLLYYNDSFIPDRLLQEKYN